MKRFALAASAAAMLITCPAHAAIVVITATGTVDTYADGTLGIFGVPASTLFGASMEEVFTFDLSKGTIQPVAQGWYRNGSGADTLGPATVTIGSYVRQIDGTRLSNYILGSFYASGGPNSVEAYTSEDTGTLLTSADMTIGTAVAPLLTSSGQVRSGTLNLTPADNAFMNFLAESDCSQSTCAYDEFGATLTSLTFAVSAPEPSVWAMMIAGFGMVGGAMRRQRRRLAVRFAIA